MSFPLIAGLVGGAGEELTRRRTAREAAERELERLTKQHELASGREQQAQAARAALQKELTGQRETFERGMAESAAERARRNLLMQSDVARISEMERLGRGDPAFREHIMRTYFPGDFVPGGIGPPAPPPEAPPGFYGIPGVPFAGIEAKAVAGARPRGVSGPPKLGFPEKEAIRLQGKIELDEHRKWSDRREKDLDSVEADIAGLETAFTRAEQMVSEAGETVFWPSEKKAQERQRQRGVLMQEAANVQENILRSPSFSGPEKAAYIQRINQIQARKLQAEAVPVPDLTPKKKAVRPISWLRTETGE